MKTSDLSSIVTPYARVQNCKGEETAQRSGEEAERMLKETRVTIHTISRIFSTSSVRQEIARHERSVSGAREHLCDPVGEFIPVTSQSRELATYHGTPTERPPILAVLSWKHSAGAVVKRVQVRMYSNLRSEDAKGQNRPARAFAVHRSL